MVMKIKPKKDAEPADAADAPVDTKQLLKEDEFLSVTGRAFDWLQHNSGKVTAAIAAVFGVAILLGAVSLVQKRSNNAASLDLSTALKTYHRPVGTMPSPDTTTPVEEQPFATAKEKYAAARDALKPVVEKHGSSGPGLVGTLYLADCEAHLGELDAAIDHYKKFLTGAGGTDSLRFLALQGLGHAQESKGDLKAAGATFEDMTKLEGKMGRDYGTLHAGRLLLAQGDKDGAKKLLEKLTKDKEFETSALKTRAEELLGTLQ